MVSNLKIKFTGSIWHLVWVNCVFVIVGTLLGLFTLGIGAVPILFWEMAWNINYILNNIEVVQ